MSEFYSAVPILQNGFIKQNYFAYFTSLYRRQREGVFLGGVEIDLTKRCTLRCKECANLMQYYKKPDRIPGETIRKSVICLLDSVDGIAMLKILGGEPLLEQELQPYKEGLICLLKELELHREELKRTPHVDKKRKQWLTFFLLSHKLKKSNKSGDKK